MIAIPGGTFWMGAAENESGASQDEYPRHQVTIAPFYLGKYPVTQAQYQAVMGSNPSHFKGDKRPVEQVSWRKAIEFCQKLSTQTGRNFRLPSEAEWEYACRAGTETPFSFGDTIAKEQVNYGRNYNQTTDVGCFPANAFGLYDMHGNVWEWCADHWHENYQGAPIDGSAWLTENDNQSRLLRGGSWDNSPDNCRSANRDHYDPENQGFDVGFRVVCV
ncbi:MAG: formylglycine-generating enzyme family protein [Cyanobacteria bacterium CRU_2_1]|nr:formylglycine-generating enzyme family protein [Cyanobacteria bacterium CRU_2_1]